MLNDKKKSILVSLLVTIGVLSTLAFSYAFVRLNANIENQKVSASSAELLLIYDECDTSGEDGCSTINKDLKVGESFTKKFSIQNDGSVNLTSHLYFTKLQNTFKNDELIYQIRNSDTLELIDSGVVPYAETLKENILITDLNIQANTTNNYEMTITFISINDDQNYNLEASYYIKLGIEMV